jgi:hypothetical protein
MRSVDSLTPDDFAAHPVWRFTDSDTPNETYVAPVCRLPVSHLDGCIVGCSLRLANGERVIGIIGNLDPSNAKSTQHFLELSLFRSDGSLFHLARYHDFDIEKRGPAALAVFLGLPLTAVFPITYDVSKVVSGLSDCVQGSITVEPKERLTEQELIALAIP